MFMYFSRKRRRIKNATLVKKVILFGSGSSASTLSKYKDQDGYFYVYNPYGEIFIFKIIDHKYFQKYAEICQNYLNYISEKRYKYEKGTHERIEDFHPVLFNFTPLVNVLKSEDILGDDKQFPIIRLMLCKEKGEYFFTMVIDGTIDANNVHEISYDLALTMMKNICHLGTYETE